MLSGFDRAVGPLQPGEQPDSLRWPCSEAAMEPLETVCTFELYDAGTGRTLMRCTVHDVSALATDWTAPHFANGDPLAVHLSEMHNLFERIGLLLGEVPMQEVHVSMETFGHLFGAIRHNLESIEKNLDNVDL